MPPAARLGDATGHGSPLAPGSGSPNVIIGGQPAWRAQVDQHSCPEPYHGAGAVQSGCPSVLINNMMACRVGDAVLEHPGPPNPIAQGCETVLMGVASTPQAPCMQQAAAHGTPFIEGPGQ